MMITPIARSFTLLLALVQMPAPAALKQATADFPKVGHVVIEAQFTKELPWDPSADIKPPLLTFRSTEGQVLKRIQFGAEKGFYTDLNFVVENLPQISTPLLVAVAVRPGGSDNLFESTIVGSINGELRDLLPDHPTTNIEGAFCLGRFGRHSNLGVLVLNFIWENRPHYVAHRYQGTLYEWTGTVFQKQAVLETKQAYVFWQSAAKELGFNCKWDFIKALLPRAR